MSTLPPSTVPCPGASTCRIIQMGRWWRSRPLCLFGSFAYMLKWLNAPTSDQIDRVDRSMGSSQMRATTAKVEGQHGDVKQQTPQNARPKHPSLSRTHSLCLPVCESVESLARGSAGFCSRSGDCRSCDWTVLHLPHTGVCSFHRSK